MDLKSLLVGVDFDDVQRRPTEGALAAARQACWLAERVGARVRFLHSTRWNPEDGPEVVAPDVDCSALEALAREHGGGRFELLRTEEPAWVALTRRVLAGESDMIVVAKRSRRRKDDRRLGSTSLKLVRECPSAVWVVRPDHPPANRAILAATDLTAVGDRAVEYGAFVAAAEGCPLVVVHAWQTPMELQLSASRIGDAEVARRKEEIAQRARDHIRAILAATPEVARTAKLLIGCDAPSRLIREAVRREDPDLAVLGTISRGGLAGVLVGNTAEKLINELECSLLTVKPVDFVCSLR